MPYIKDAVKSSIEGGSAPSNAGELNYVLTRVCLEYFYNEGSRYQEINDILGALEGAKLEFYRRVAAPYEDVKREENGDVYI